MKIQFVRWKAGTEHDIHVLAGEQTRELVQDIWLVVDNTGYEVEDFLKDHKDMELVFRPRLKGSEAGDVISCHGVEVNQRTGAVKVHKPAPAVHRRHNFILEAVVRPRPGKAGPTPPPVPIRVHLHQSVTQVWLSPPTLTVRQGVPDQDLPESTSFRFSVRAKFDDGTMGDLTNRHGVTWGPNGNVDEAGRLFIVKGKAPGATVTITATLPAGLGGASASGTLRIAEPWNALSTPVRAQIVTGGAWPGTINPEAVPNVLVLGDGFATADGELFHTMADAMVTQLKTSRLTRPYDLLSTSMNFWKVLPPPGGGGVSCRCEFYTFMADGVLNAWPLEPARRPEGEAGWKMGHLLYAVGLPVPADAGRSNETLLAEWDAVIGPEPRARVPDAVISRWKTLGSRVFLEEVDSFPGMALGRPPAAVNSEDSPLVVLHPDRGGPDELDRFLSVLQSASGVALAGGAPLGNVWVPVKNNPRRDTVVLFNRYPGGRPSFEAFVQMGTSSRTGRMPVVPVAGRPELAALLAPPPDHGQRARTLAHELGHALGLGDEYVEKAESYPATEETQQGHGNLQTEAAVPLAPGALKAGNIKWDWHRVRKAAVLTGPATAAGTGRFRLPVRLGHALQFAAGNVVLLRRRLPHQVLQTGAQVLDRHLRVVVQPATPGDAVVVEAAPGFTVSLADLAPYGNGSLLFLPVASKVEAEVYARLVAHNIRAHMAKTGPLTGTPCKPDLAGKVQTPRLEGVDLPWCFKNRPRVVGLYHGGATWGCGIFHPTGTCMMNDSDGDGAEFCAVCRYVMVDLVDPSRHWEIDRDYEDIYPQT